jgi:hypothetical protein
MNSNGTAMGLTNVELWLQFASSCHASAPHRLLRLSLLADRGAVATPDASGSSLKYFDVCVVWVRMWHAYRRPSAHRPG